MEGAPGNRGSYSNHPRALGRLPGNPGRQYTSTMTQRRKPLQPLKTPEQEARALAQRTANQRALAEGEAMPYPNVWDRLDPTKVPCDATPDQISQRYKEFCKICPPPKRIEYIL